MKTILVTGGAGYIGSLTTIELLIANYEVVVLDNLSNSSPEALRRVQNISGEELAFYKADLLDRPALESIFKAHKFDAVIHFAGLKAVGESVQEPVRYYHNNVTGSLTLFSVMAEYEVRNIVFSSSATVYGDPDSVPVNEEASLRPTNPYGWTKLMIEQILRDQHVADPDWNAILLRYFNPVGAHPSGELGESPRGAPNNLMPYLAQVAVGRRPNLQIYGNDYDTPDGTGVRDYIHVSDLAKGHLAALRRLKQGGGVEAFNLGTGRGYSVMEMVKAFEKASGKEIPYNVVARRSGDIATSFADPTKAHRDLNWEAEKGLDEMCVDLWRWQSKYPEGLQ
ncbi:MAG: UDP-glucose 4-epimerase GalE [Anaerolineae bacterium]|nr:MAG: UDP-glucose 4-epimerase GalE [Anaerolineae bacterium]